MKHLSIAFILTLIFSTGAAYASPAMKPAASFDVGVTHVDKYGSGEPALILVPGLTDSAAVWNGTVAHFAATHTVYALTLAGFGGQKPAADPLVPKAIADIATLIAQEHLNKPVLIGHSLGGFTTIRFAEAHSDLIRGAMAIDGLPTYPGFDKMTPAQRVSAAAQMTGPMAKATSAQMDAFEKANVVPYLTQKANVDEVAAAGAGANPVASAEYMTELLTTDARDDLSKVTVPLVEIAPFDPTLDPYNPQGGFKTSAEKVAYYRSLFVNDKTAKVELIDNSRHFVMFDQPAALYDAISAFLKTLP